MLRGRGSLVFAFAFILMLCVGAPKADSQVSELNVYPGSSSYTKEPLYSKLNSVVYYVLNRWESVVFPNPPSRDTRQLVMKYFYNSAYFTWDNSLKCSQLVNYVDVLTRNSRPDVARVMLYLSESEKLNCFGEGNQQTTTYTSNTYQPTDQQKQVNDYIAALLRQKVKSRNIVSADEVNDLDSQGYFNKNSSERHNFLSSNAKYSALLKTETEDNIYVVLRFSSQAGYYIKARGKWVKISSSSVDGLIEKLANQNYFNKPKDQRLQVLDMYSDSYPDQTAIISELENHESALEQQLGILNYSQEQGDLAYHGGFAWKDFFIRSCSSKNVILFETGPECFTNKKNWSKQDLQELKTMMLLPTRDKFDTDLKDFTQSERLFLESIYCDEKLYQYYQQIIDGLSKNLTEPEKASLATGISNAAEMWANITKDFLNSGIQPEHIYQNMLDKRLWTAIPKTKNDLEFLYKAYQFDKTSQDFSESEVDFIRQALNYFKILPSSFLDTHPTLQNSLQAVDEGLVRFKANIDSEIFKMSTGNDNMIAILADPGDLPLHAVMGSFDWLNGKITYSVADWLVVRVGWAIRSLHFWTLDTKGTLCKIPIDAVRNTVSDYNQQN